MLFKYNLKYEISESFVSEMLLKGLMLPSTLQLSCLKRRCQFLAGRYCVLECYALLGKFEYSFPGVGINKLPIWPDDINGSISHSNTNAVALISTSNGVNIGIDVESYIDKTTAQKLFKLIIGVTDFVNNIFDISTFVTLIFSAKESIYKAFNENVKHFLSFDLIMLISIDPIRRIINFHIGEQMKIPVYVTYILLDDFVETHCIHELLNISYFC